MQREFRGHMRVLSTQGEKLCKVQILALNDTINRNGWRYVNLEQHKNQFRDIPILTAYVSDGDGIGGGHNFDMKHDEAGEEYASFTAADAERIVGWVPGSAEVKVIRRDNANWIQVTGNLWRWRRFTTAPKSSHAALPWCSAFTRFCAMRCTTRG